MAMKVGKREKLVAGIIIMIATIAAIHLLVYHPRSSDYKKAKLDHTYQKNVLSQQQSQNVVEGFNQGNYLKSTDKYKADYDKYLSSLDLNVEAYWLKDNPTDAKKRDVEFEKAVNNLIQFREKYELFSQDSRANAQKTKKKQDFENRFGDTKGEILANLRDKSVKRIGLSFLEKDGWNFPRREDFKTEFLRNDSAGLADKTDNIREKINILQFMKIPERKMELLDSLRRNLIEVGVDHHRLVLLNDARIQQGLSPFGEIVPTLKMMAHVEMLETFANRQKKASKSYDFKKEEFRTGLFNHIYTGFDEEGNEAPRLTYPGLEIALTTTRQIEALNDILELARNNDIQDIKSVFLYPKAELVTFEAATAPGATPPPAVPAPPGGGALGAAAGAPRNDPRAASGLSAGGGPPSAGASSTGTAPEVEPTRKILGAITPIRIEFVSTNENAWNFLYKISTGERFLADKDNADAKKALYEIDNIKLIGDEQGVVTVDFVLGVIPFVVGISDEVLKQVPADKKDAPAPPNNNNVASPKVPEVGR